MTWIQYSGSIYRICYYYVGWSTFSCTIRENSEGGDRVSGEGAWGNKRKSLQKGINHSTGKESWSWSTNIFSTGGQTAVWTEGAILVVARLIAFFVMRNMDGFNNKRGQLEKTVEQMQLGYFKSMQLVRLQMI